MVSGRRSTVYGVLIGYTGARCLEMSESRAG